MKNRRILLGSTVVAVVLVVAWISAIEGRWVGGGPGSDEESGPSLVDRAKHFRSLIEEERYEEARALMAREPRRWWGSREGEGRPWSVGPDRRGPWAAWDEHFESQKKIVEWREEAGAATALIRESNDYFRLLERGPVTNEVTYFFDETGRIDGLLIRPVGQRPPGRTEEFLAWAETNDRSELDALMPGGEIDPSGDHPERFRRLLERWRLASGLPPILQ